MQQWKLGLAMTALAVLAVGCSEDSAGGDTADASVAQDGSTTSGNAGGLGLGCDCQADPNCTAGFCSSLSVCTTSDALECADDTDCDCGARCVVAGDNQSCQIPCATTIDCPGLLECAPLQPGWTTTAGDLIVQGCVAPAQGEAVTWDAHIQPLVQATCSPCHLAGGASGGVSFDTYADTQLLVDDCPPGDARTLAAVMAEKVAPNPPCGQRMPLGGAPLTDAEVQLFADWVAAGAPLN